MSDYLQINIFNIEVCIYVLCVCFVKSRRNLFTIYFLNVRMLCLFGVGFDKFSLLLISLMWMISFLLLRVMTFLWLILIKLVVITFSIWMIWRMRNYARFQVKIDVSRTISVIKDFTCLMGNSFRSSTRNDMFDFNVL